MPKTQTAIASQNKISKCSFKGLNQNTQTHTLTHIQSLGTISYTMRHMQARQTDENCISLPSLHHCSLLASVQL